MAELFLHTPYIGKMQGRLSRGRPISFTHKVRASHSKSLANLAVRAGLHLAILQRSPSSSACSNRVLSSTKNHPYCTSQTSTTIQSSSICQDECRGHNWYIINLHILPPTSHKNYSQRFKWQRITLADGRHSPQVWNYQSSQPQVPQNFQEPYRNCSR